MIVQPERLRSRRNLLKAAVAGSAAALATVLGHAPPTSAASAVQLGVDNQAATTMTEIVNTTNDNFVFRAMSSGGGPGVSGYSSGGNGVYGHSNDGVGVRGDTVRANVAGVHGNSSAGVGVKGTSFSNTAVLGSSDSGEGVRGISNGSNGTAGSSGSGIASGVYGENTAGGFGTYGRSNAASTAAVGVFGETVSGTGVGGISTTGVGVVASTRGTGLAFKAVGRVTFSTAGLITLTVGAKSKSIVPGVNLVAHSVVLCTLESNQNGLSIQRVLKNTLANTFTVYLSGPVASGKSAKVAWFVIG